jgi:hypothetical protein
MRVIKLIAPDCEFVARTGSDESIEMCADKPIPAAAD